MTANPTEVMTETLDSDSKHFLRLWREDLQRGHTGSESTELTYNGIEKFIAIIDHLSGELASRPAKELVEAARNLVDSAERAIEQCPCSISERDSGHRVGCFAPALSEAVDRMPALSQASSADALSAPAKEGVVLFEYDAGGGEYWLYATSHDSKKVVVFRDNKWNGTRDYENGPTAEYELKYPRERRLSDSEAAAFLAEHPLPKDAFSPAPVAGEPSVTIKTTPVPKWAQDRIDHALKHGTDAAHTASAVSPASEEKDAKNKAAVDEHGFCKGCGLHISRCAGDPACEGKAAPAPAPSEEYPGVRVFKCPVESPEFRIWTGSEMVFIWNNYQKIAPSVVSTIQEAIHGFEGKRPDTEVYGHVRQLVIEHARKLRPDLFGAPGAAKKDHLAVDEAREKLERQIRVWSSGSADFMARHIESFIDAKLAAMKGGANV